MITKNKYTKIKIFNHTIYSYEEFSVKPNKLIGEEKLLKSLHKENKKPSLIGKIKDYLRSKLLD